MLEIVARMIILASEQHPQSERFQFQKTSDELTREAGLPQQGGEAESCGEVGVEKVAKENPLSRFIRWVKTRSRTQTYQQPEDSHGAELLAVALAPQPTIPSKAYQTAVSDIMDKLVKSIARLRNEKPGEAKDIIRCLVNTIQSFSTKGQKPSIIQAGTHRDLLEVKAEQAASVTRTWSV